MLYHTHPERMRAVGSHCTRSHTGTKRMRPGRSHPMYRRSGYDGHTHPVRGHTTTRPHHRHRSIGLASCGCTQVEPCVVAWCRATPIWRPVRAAEDCRLVCHRRHAASKPTQRHSPLWHDDAPQHQLRMPQVHTSWRCAAGIGGPVSSVSLRSHVAC